MKTYRNLWPRVCCFPNLYSAWRRAKRGKSKKAQVIAFERDLEENLLDLLAELEHGIYRPGPYTNFYVRETKRRKVSAAPWAPGLDGARILTVPLGAGRCPTLSALSPTTYLYPSAAPLRPPERAKALVLG